MVQLQPTSVLARPKSRAVLGPVLGLVALGLCGLLVLGLVTAQVGPEAVLIGALCAMLPVVPVVAAFLWVDRWEPEPPRLLLVAFLWGACFATLSALLINSTAAIAADELLGRGSGDLVGSVVSAPIVEEAMKGAFLVGLLIFRRREFDGVIDGIVYAGLVAAGFAFTENILYFGRTIAEDASVGQVGGVGVVLLLRGLLSPFAHPLFTAMFGIGLGIGVTARNPAVRLLAPVLGFAAAVGLHALWNGSATLFGGTAFALVYLVIMLPIFVAVVLVIIWQRRREQQVVAAALPRFAQAGWIAPSEVQLLSSLAGRRGWRRAVRRQHGSAAAKAVAGYQAAVSELAFLYDRIANGRAGPTARAWHDELLAALGRARAQATGMPQAMTAAFRRPPPGWTPPSPSPPGWRPPPPPPGWVPPNRPGSGQAWWSPHGSPPGGAPAGPRRPPPGQQPPGRPPGEQPRGAPSGQQPRGAPPGQYRPRS